MKKAISVLLVSVWMVTFLSGCDFWEELKQNRELEQAGANIQTMMEADSLKMTGETRLSLSGVDFGMAMTMETTLVYRDRGTEEMQADLYITGTSGGVAYEQLLHYENGIAYFDFPDLIDKAKETMSTEEFMSWAGLTSIIEDDGRALSEYAEMKYDNSSKSRNVLTLTDDTATQLPVLLELIGVPDEYASATEYKETQTYTFDKDMVLQKLEQTLTCKLTLFGETVSVILVTEMDFTDNVGEFVVPELLYKDSYTDKGKLKYQQAFYGAYNSMDYFKSAKAREEQRFSMTSAIPEEYSYQFVNETTQNFSAADVTIRQNGTQDYVINMAGQRKDVHYTTSYTFEEGVGTSVVDGESTTEEWVNPLSCYFSAGYLLYNGAMRSENELDTLTFEEKEGQLICRYTLTQDSLDDLAYYNLTVFFGEETATQLLPMMKAESYTENTGELVLDRDTGTILSHRVQIGYAPTVNGVRYECEYAYSMTISDTVRATDTDSSGMGSIAI